MTTTFFHSELPEEYTQGIRVLWHAARKKDGCPRNRNRSFISPDATSFRRILEEIVLDAGERIYASLDARDLNKAMLAFKQRQLINDFAPYEERLRFHTNLENEWTSCLMAPSSRGSKLFMLDIDTKADHEAATRFLEKNQDIILRNAYKTKSAEGVHMILEPFNPVLLPDALAPCLKQNAMVLWKWRNE